MKRIIVLLLVLVLALSVCACSGNDSAKSTKDEAGALTVISTPYAELRAPAYYDDKLKYEVESKDPYTLTFITKDDGTKLYSLIFNGKGDLLLGTILGNDEYTTLYATVYPLDQQDENYDEKAQCQEDMYIILTNIRKEYAFEDNEAVEKPDTFEIKTDVVTLHYPQKWKDKVDVKTDSESVVFSSGGTELFIVSFVDDGGYPLGKYQGQPIYLTTGTLEGVDPASEEYKELVAMQGDVNVLIEILERDPDFVSAH